MNKLERKVIELSYKYKLSHVGSCLCTVNVLDKIYSIRKSNEPVILDNAHASLALYVVLEKYGYGNAEELWKQHGTHCNRDTRHGIWASGGSLGHGCGIAVSMAILDPKRLVYLVMSDGSLAEGSCWEALRIARDLKLENLRTAIIANGYGAYGRIDTEDLDARANAFYPTMMIKTNLFSLPEWIQGQNGHYVVMNKKQYEEIINL